MAGAGIARTAGQAELVAADGDAALAATLAELALTLPMFISERLRAAGPIVGQQLANAGRQLIMPGMLPSVSATAGARW
jgi:hypothetical protein